MKNTFYLVIVLNVLILTGNLVLAQEEIMEEELGDDPGCEENFCSLIKGCEEFDTSDKECYIGTVEWFRNCILSSKFTGGHACGDEHAICLNTCLKNFPSTNQGNEAGFFKCNDDCGFAFDSCITAVPTPSCTGEKTKKTTPTEKKECKQITEETARYDAKFYYPKCKDRTILVTYVCKNTIDEPQEIELSCPTIKYEGGKTYHSCSQPLGQQGSCSTEEIELTLEEVKSKLEKIKNNNAELFNFIIDHPEIVYMVSKNKDQFKTIKDENDLEIWLKVIKISKEIDRMKQNAYTYIQSHGAGTLLEYVKQDQTEIELWQLKLYTQLEKIIEERTQEEIETNNLKLEIKQLEKEYEILERQKYWNEQASFIDKSGYRIGYITSFQALREKGYSQIFDNKNTRFHEKIGEASGILAYLPGTGDAIEIATLPSVLQDERMNLGEKTLHIICASLPFINSAVSRGMIQDIFPKTKEDISNIAATISVQTTDVEYK